MAYSAANLTTAETTGFSADKPLLVAQSASSPSDAHWNFQGDHTKTDKTASDKPSTRAHDSVGSLITEPTNITKNITNATQANPCVITSAGHGLENGDKVFLTGFSGGMTDLNDSVFTVAGKTTDTFQLDGINSTGFSAYSSGGKLTTVKFYNFFFSTAISFDTLCITGHNLNSMGAVSVSLEIADSSSFGTNLIEIAKYTVSGSTDNRILITNLNSAGGSSTYDANGTAQRYSSVAYARIKIIHSTTAVPKVGEIFLGTRHQLQRNPDVPWNNKNEFSNTTDFTSLSGIVKRYVAYRGQALRNFKASISADAEITVIDDWFNAINEGTKPFLYIETPSSNADAYLMILDDAALRFPLVGPFERVLEFSMTEQPPFLSIES